MENFFPMLLSSCIRTCFASGIGLRTDRYETVLLASVWNTVCRIVGYCFDKYTSIVLL